MKKIVISLSILIILSFVTIIFIKLWSKIEKIDFNISPPYREVEITNKIFQQATGDCVGLDKCKSFGTQDWYFLYFTEDKTTKSQNNYNIGDIIRIYEE